MPFLVQFVLIIGIIYFIMVRPQQKQRRQHEEALKGLKRGDEIVTAGGIVGEVIHIRETTQGRRRQPPRRSRDDQVRRVASRRRTRSHREDHRHDDASAAPAVTTSDEA